MLDEAIKLFSHSKAHLMPAFEVVYSELVDNLGCRPYVKTIYVSFSVGTVVVASVHPFADHFEVALPLEQVVAPRVLAPAAHLKWRDLTTMVSIRHVDDAERAIPLLRQAYEQVAPR